MPISLSPDFEIKEMALKEVSDGTLSSKEAAQMTVILKGITVLLPFLMGLVLAPNRRLAVSCG